MKLSMLVRIIEDVNSEWINNDYIMYKLNTNVAGIN